MYLIVLGALVVAIGVAMVSLPAGVIVLGVELVAAGVYRDLTAPDDDQPTDGEGTGR